MYMIATQDEDKQRKNTTQYVLDRTIHYIGLFIFLVILMIMQLYAYFILKNACENIEEQLVLIYYIYGLAKKPKVSLWFPLFYCLLLDEKTKLSSFKKDNPNPSNVLHEDSIILYIIYTDNVAACVTCLWYYFLFCSMQLKLDLHTSSFFFHLSAAWELHTAATNEQVWKSNFN